MSRSKELLVLVVDVGPEMEPHLALTSRAIFSLLNSKILFKPTHQVSVVFYGTTETDNSLHEEMNSNGEEGQYTCIKELVPMNPPEVGSLLRLKNVGCENGASDFLDAVVVAADVLLRKVRAEKALEKASKRIVLMSSFAGKAKPLSEAFRDRLVSSLSSNNIRLEVVSIDFNIDEEHSAQKASNRETLTDLLHKANGTLKSARDECQLLGSFTAKDTAHTCMYKGPLSMGGDLMDLNVRVYKKAAKATVPSLKLYSDRSTAAGATHKVMRETEYKTQTDPDNPVTPEERVKAYKYGKQTVPLSQDEEENLQYASDRDLHILGFVNASQVPRHHYMSEPYMIIPEDDNSRLAVSALCGAMRNQGKVAIVRTKLNKRSTVSLGVLMPFETEGSNLDCFVMNILPFAEDVRNYPFASFQSKPDLIPSETQLNAAQKVIDAMDLTSHGDHEKLCPDSTVNPILHRFYLLLGNKALDSQATFPESDKLLAGTLDPQLDKMGASDILADCKNQFPITETVAKPAVKEDGTEFSKFSTNTAANFSSGSNAQASVDGVGTSTPVEDFGVLISAGKVDAAMKGMEDAIFAIVTASIGDRSYPKAMQSLSAFRRECVAKEKSNEFNAFLRKFCETYKEDAVHCAMWALVVGSGVTLIDEQEVPGCGVSRAEAEDFIKPAEPAVVRDEEMAEEEDDDFEGME
ncbi:hypothetical protein BSKO_00451 [Bryopsis sp. KO-2023]|nr:hypothetical protein BSKO_00451 [Bryopsis sp. KO-2023]